MKTLAPLAVLAAATIVLSGCGMYRDSGRQASARSPTATQSTAQMPGQALNPETVRSIQSSLKTQGYQVGPVDGIYGQNTYQAVRQFQMDRGLRPSGQLDGQTMAALGVPSGSQTATTPNDDAANRARAGNRTQSAPILDEAGREPGGSAEGTTGTGTTGPGSAYPGTPGGTGGAGQFTPPR